MKSIVCCALLFDMDGTIVDSTAAVEHAWSIWAGRNGISLPELLAYSHGRPTLDTMNYFRPGGEWEQDAREMMAMEETEASGTAEVPGAKEILARLPPSKWAVVTSAPRRLAESRIQAAGLPLPRVLVPADEITRGKPNPEGYLKAARELNASPSDCLVFEDTRPGIEAGLNAGMQVIGLLTTVPAEKLGCRLFVRDYRGLTLIENNGEFTITLL